MTLGATGADPLIPPWLAFPVAAVLVVIIAIHLQSLRHAEMPASRKRIRTANGWLMIAATPITAYAFGGATPQQARIYVLVWLAVAGLLGMVMLLACIDVLNNRRLHRFEQRRLGAQVGGEVAAQLRAELAARARRPRGEVPESRGGGGSHGG